MRKVAGTLKLDLAQYRELEAFSKFGSDLDKATTRTLAKGARLVELLKQAQYAPLPIEKQVVSVYLGTNNYFENVPIKSLKKFENEFLEYVELRYPQIFESIRSEKVLTEPTLENIKKAFSEFSEKFNAA